MIPLYIRTRSIDEYHGNDFASQTLDKKDSTKQINENLTHNPQKNGFFAADTTVGAFEDPDGLHPVIKYGIPIGAMFLLGLFIYATFSKRWNRRAALATISVESMKLNTSGSIDSIADYVSSQIENAESSVLRHIKENIGNTSEAIINDIPVVNEEELTSGLKKTIAQQEAKLIDNIKKNFEETKISIVNDARDKFTLMEETIESILKKQNANDDMENKTDFVATIEQKDLNRELSEIQNNLSVIIQGKISNSPDALLSVTEKQILYIADIFNNIMPKTLQSSDQDPNTTRSRIKKFEESLLTEVKTIIIYAEENILEYIQNQINEVKQISKKETTSAPRENYQNDMEVDIKQPGKISRNETLDTVEKTLSEKIVSTYGKIDVGSTSQKQAIQQDQNLCSKCVAVKNSFEESNKTLAVGINEKYDKMEEITLRTETDNTITKHANLDENKEENNEESTVIIPSLNNEKESFELHGEEKLEIRETETKKNYSVREQAENSIKLWLARFKQAVPHLSDNLIVPDKYNKLENSIGQKTSNEKSIEPIEHVVIDVDEMYNSTEHQDYSNTGPSEQSLNEEDKKHNQKWSNAESETIEVEIHKHPTENEQKESEEGASTTLLNIDKWEGGVKEVEGRISEDSDVRLTTENYEKSELEEMKKEMQVEMRKPLENDPKEKSDFSDTLLNIEDESFRSDGMKEVEGNRSDNLGVKSSTDTQHEKINAINYDGFIEKNEKETEVEMNKHPHGYEMKVSEDNADFFKPLLNVNGESTELDVMKELERKTGELELGSSTENQEAEKNAVYYERFTSEIEQKKKEIILASTNTVSDKTEKSESETAISKKWFNIDEIIVDEKESWPSHLPKIVNTPMLKENDLKKTRESESAQGGEAAKNDILSEHNDKERIDNKEWIINEETLVKSRPPHEEIIKICEGKALDRYKQEHLDSNTENSNKVEIDKTTKNSEELCQDYFAKFGNLISSKIEENNLKEPLEPVLSLGTQYFQNKEGNEAPNIEIFDEDKILEGNKEKWTDKTQENMEEKAEDMQNEEKYIFNAKEWSNDYKEVNKEKDDFHFDNNDSRKESVVSTSSDVSSSSNEATLNEALQKEEERDSFPVLKMPNMDNKLRRKRKINRRQLKSLDSGVHHYYGEYIAIEFPINESDEPADQSKRFDGIKQSSSVSETSTFISSTSGEHGNEEGEISPAKTEDEH